METIEAVIFDWGGVLIEDPAPGMIRYLADALKVSEQDYLAAGRKYHPEFQLGRISEQTFWTGVCRELSVPMPKEDSLWTLAFEAVYRPENNVFALAERLRKNGCRTAVLSNTEKPAVKLFHRQDYGIFDALVFSCELGTKKPDREIYEHAIERLSVEPAEAVLIDDRQENIDGAKTAGLKGILFANARQAEAELARLGIDTG